MDTLYVILGLVWAIISIVAVVKFFQMASDVRELKNHLVGKFESSAIMIRSDEEIKGTIRKSQVTYTILNGSTKFSDGKVGFVNYLPNGRCSVNINGEDVVFDDVYYAVDALYENLKQ